MKDNISHVILSPEETATYVLKHQPNANARITIHGQLGNGSLSDNYYFSYGTPYTRDGSSFTTEYDGDRTFIFTAHTKNFAGEDISYAGTPIPYVFNSDKTKTKQHIKTIKLYLTEDVTIGAQDYGNLRFVFPDAESTAWYQEHVIGTSEIALYAKDNNVISAAKVLVVDFFPAKASANDLTSLTVRVYNPENTATIIDSTHSLAVISYLA